MESLVVFTLAGRKLALPLESVERIVAAVEVTPVLDTPPVVLGIINVQGQTVPVLDLRTSIGRSSELALSDQLIIAHGTRGRVALVAEEVSGVVEFARAETSPEDVLPGLEDVRSQVLQDGGEIILLCRLDRLMSEEVIRALREALKG